MSIATKIFPSFCNLAESEGLSTVMKDPKEFSIACRDPSLQKCNGKLGIRTQRCLCWKYSVSGSNTTLQRFNIKLLALVTQLLSSKRETSLGELHKKPNHALVKVKSSGV